MSYIAPVAGSDPKNGQHSVAKDFQISPVSASEEPSKDASLQPDDDCPGSSFCRKGQHSIFRRLWHWSVRNITVIALVCLVLGGLVTIIVYFGGQFLRPKSKIRTEIA